MVVRGIAEDIGRLAVEGSESAMRLTEDVHQWLVGVK